MNLTVDPPPAVQVVSMQSVTTTTRSAVPAAGRLANVVDTTRGLVRDGWVPKTVNPVPVSSVRAVAKFALLGVPKKVATPAPNPLTPVPIGRPVAFVKTPEVGVPKSGVTNVGEVANTNAPDPVSLVTAVAKFALLGVPKKVATPAARPLTPVSIGRPVALVNTPDVGVPSRGVTNVGDVAKTRAPVPVSFVTAVMRLALEGVPRKVAMPAAKPLTPVLIGNPVAFVRVPDVGVPSKGVTRVGLVFITNVDPVPVCEATDVALPTLVIGPVKLALVVTVAALPVVL